MPMRLPNGTYRVQIRRRGFPPVDRTFNSLKAAQAFEDEEREKIALGPTPLNRSLRFEPPRVSRRLVGLSQAVASTA
jgi:hypothetical protein